MAAPALRLSRPQPGGRAGVARRAPTLPLVTVRPLPLPRAVVVALRATTGLLFVMMGSWKVGANEYAMGGRIGELFAFFATLGPWWALVGWTQIAAGVLLVTQRFATAAALALFGVTVNIAAINAALWPEFGTTMGLTAYALVALTLLLWHDLDRWEYVFWKRPPTPADLEADRR